MHAKFMLVAQISTRIPRLEALKVISQVSLEALLELLRKTCTVPQAELGNFSPKGIRTKPRTAVREGRANSQMPR